MNIEINPLIIFKAIVFLVVSGLCYSLVWRREHFKHGVTEILWQRIERGMASRGWYNAGTVLWWRAACQFTSLPLALERQAPFYQKLIFSFDYSYGPKFLQDAWWWESFASFRGRPCLVCHQPLSTPKVPFAEPQGRLGEFMQSRIFVLFVLISFPEDICLGLIIICCSLACDQRLEQGNQKIRALQPNSLYVISFVCYLVGMLFSLYVSYLVCKYFFRRVLVNCSEALLFSSFDLGQKQTAKFDWGLWIECT